jgi:spermidine synthase
MDELTSLARNRREDRPALVRGSMDWKAWASNRASLSYLDALVDPPADEDRARHNAADAYSKSELGNVLPEFKPVNSNDLVMLAESLANRGDDAAVAYAEQLRVWQPTDADAVLARLRFQQNRLDEAATLLERVFARGRIDPWPNVDTFGRSLDIAMMLASKYPYAARMYRALEHPFAAGQWEDTRKIDRALISKEVEGCGPHTIAAIRQLEPWVPWRKDLLKLRVDCYGTAMLEDLHARAQRDLEAFVSAEPPPLLSSSDRK